MGPVPVALVSAVAFLGGIGAILRVYWSLRHQGWSLANALSEPTRLVIPRQPGWSESQGDSASRGQESSFTGEPVAVTLMEPSSSRLIATMGSIAILMVYMGFAVFALYNFGLTCSMPASTGAVSSFLFSGLALFAPYIANKVSSLFRPFASGPAGTAAASAVAEIGRAHV